MTGDADLVHLAQIGDAGALGVLLERHRPRLYASALAILGDSALAQDAVQDAFLIALRRIGELREPAAAAAWLHAIVRNACRMRLRKDREAPGLDLATIDDRSSSADEALDHLALRDWLWTALEDLPDDLRATVMLRYFTNHAAYAEIAAILGIPVGTVRSRLNQAKRRLAQALRDVATATHHDHAALVAERWQWWSAVKDQVEREGSAALYIADAAPHASVEAPLLGYRAIGAEEQGRGMVETVAAGVRVELMNIIASVTLSIVEFALESPANDPHHCPRRQTEVRYHSREQTTRIILYYGNECDPALAVSGVRGQASKDI